MPTRKIETLDTQDGEAAQDTQGREGLTSGDMWEGLLSREVDYQWVTSGLPMDEY